MDDVIEEDLFTSIRPSEYNLNFSIVENIPAPVIENTPAPVMSWANDWDLFTAGQIDLLCNADFESLNIHAYET